jgi:polyphosphate kinase
VDIRPLMPLVDLPALEDLRDAPLGRSPSSRRRARLFALLDERDVVLHHPYESFDPVVALMSGAAEDPDVLAIKQTLYRTSGDSPGRALARTGRRERQAGDGARGAARPLRRGVEHPLGPEPGGVGLPRHLRHPRLQDPLQDRPRGAARRQGIRRYVHLGTGNYNEKTARLYTDFGLMTSDREIGEDASAFFNALTGYSDPPRMKKLVMAPTQLRDRVLRLVNRERQRAEAGAPAEIRAKMNSLVDEEIIRALYDAARPG